MVTGNAFESYTTRDDETHNVFDEEVAIKELVTADQLEIFFNEHWVVGVNANDMFYFACSDTVEVESAEALQSLYQHCVDDPKTGAVAWACKERNMQPCARCYINPMKDAGTWTAELEALPKGPQS